jgi:hypothetical protein
MSDMGAISRLLVEYRQGLTCALCSKCCSYQGYSWSHLSQPSSLQFFIQEPDWRGSQVSLLQNKQSSDETWNFAHLCHRGFCSENSAGAFAMSRIEGL